jgi:hypothetical protein
LTSVRGNFGPQAGKPPRIRASEDEIEAKIADLIAKRNEIRAWGWNTGRNWRDDFPPEMKKRQVETKRSRDSENPHIPVARPDRVSVS